MVTSDTIINGELQRSGADDSHPEKAVIFKTPSELRNSKFENQQTEWKVLIPGQIAIPINDRKAIRLSNSNPNKSYSKSEETPEKKIYEKCLKLFRLLAFILGIRVAHNWQPLKSFSYLFNCFFHSLTGFSILYTVYIHYIHRYYMRMMEPIAVSGLLVSCDLKMYGFILHGHQILALIFSIHKYFRPNFFGRQLEVLKSCLGHTWKLIFTIATGYVVALSFYSATPVIIYFGTGEITPLVPLEIIFCDLTQTSGFVYTTIVHLIMGSYSAVVSMLYDTIFIFIICNYILQANLIAEDFKELDRLWNDNSTSVPIKRAFLINICRKRQDMNVYLKIVKGVYETKLFIYFCFNYFSQIMCLYNITQNNWIGGYGPGMGLFLEMMFYCYIGTQVSVTDDKLCHCIYHCNWYEYDLKSQWVIFFLLHDAQKPKELRLESIGNLNMVTGISIFKSIYSFYTVLTELF